MNTLYLFLFFSKKKPLSKQAQLDPDRMYKLEADRIWIGVGNQALDRRARLKCESEGY